MLTQLKKRMETGVLVAAIVIPAALCVFAFLGIACYFALLDVLPPSLAALVTAAAGIVLIALVLVIARIGGASGQASGKGKRSRSRPGSDAYGEDFERLLRDHADPVLARWIQDNPDKAAIATLALGVAAGYSDHFRRALFDLYARYSESEAVRRSRHPEG